MMKLNLYAFVFLINIIASTINAQNRIKKPGTLEITGAAKFNNHLIGDYSISIYLDGSRIDSIYTKSKKPIKLSLSYNKAYTFLFQKQDCFDKIIIVNTQIPTSLKKMDDNTFDFAVELKPLSKNQNDFERNSVAVLMINENDEFSKIDKPQNKFIPKDSENFSIDASNKLPSTSKNLDK